MSGRLTVSLKPQPAMTVHRTSIGNEKLCYIVRVNKAMRYAYGRSRIVYIGTTKKGANRIAQSAAGKSVEVLNLHGVTDLEVRVVTCAPRQNVKTWAKLERALLLGFREIYGEIPLCNTQGKNMREGDEFDYFTRQRIRTILQQLES